MSATHDRVSRSRAVIAHEGWAWLFGSIVAGVIAYRLGYIEVAAAMAAITVFLFLLFRDPTRVVPPLPTAIYSPVDGRVLEVAEVSSADFDTGWWRVRVRPSRLGAYTVRAPIEGTIEGIPEGAVAGPRPAGLGILSEEGDRVLLVFPHGGRLHSPRAFVRYGERLGQGERFAYLRLARLADIYLPRSCRLLVVPGERVKAGDTVISELVAA